MTTTTWTNTAGGNFNTGTNWSAGVPAAGDTALITAKGTYTVTLGQGESVGTLEMAKGVTLATAGHNIAITSGTAKALAGTITGPAWLELGTDGTPTSFDNAGAINSCNLEISGPVTLAGKGEVTLSSNAVEADNQSATLTNSGNTISGNGSIGGDGFLSMVNAKGIISAVGSNVTSHRD